MEVEARYMDSAEWFPGKIMAVYPAGSRKLASKDTLYDLRYEDGDTEDGVRRLKIRVKGERQRRKLEVGEEVDGSCAACDGAVYGGVVVGEAGEDMYRVEFDLEAAGVSKQYGRERVEEVVPRKKIFAMHSNEWEGKTGSSGAARANGSVTDISLSCIGKEWSGADGVVARTIVSISSVVKGKGICEGFLMGTLSRQRGENGQMLMAQKYKAADLYLGGLRDEFNGEDLLGKCVCVIV